MDVTVFEGAHHGFNHEWKPKYFHNSWTFRDCGKIFTDEPVPKDGYISLSDKPGFGVTLNKEVELEEVKF